MEKPNIKSIHPFAARMAPEIALKAISKLPRNSTVLDPMAGSGTVLRMACMHGHRAIGFDMDPLAVLMSRVWTTQINEEVLEEWCEMVIKEAQKLKAKDVKLPWIDSDKETLSFTKFWFASKQRNDLRKISYVLKDLSSEYSDALRIALTRIIITKSKGASLAGDISHSRPHKIRTKNDFDVLIEFRKSCKRLAKNLRAPDLNGIAEIKLGDARCLQELDTASIPLIVTSPPYLNAIDYLRGHKFGLIWLGYSIPELRRIRSETIGVERVLSDFSQKKLLDEILRNIEGLDLVPLRRRKMINRYAMDILGLMTEFKRVLRRKGKAILVVGNSTHRGVFIENSRIVENAAQSVGLRINNRFERVIPSNRRYLPPPASSGNGALSSRMRKEVVLTFQKP